MASDAPTEERDRSISRFARFFRNYSVALSLIVATIPALTSYWDVVPMFLTIEAWLTIGTSVACYLLVGFLFSQRHRLARAYIVLPYSSETLKVRHRVLTRAALNRQRVLESMPVFLGFLFLICLSLYFVVLGRAVNTIALQHTVPTVRSRVFDEVDIINDVLDSGETPERTRAMFELEQPYIVEFQAFSHTADLDVYHDLQLSRVARAGEDGWGVELVNPRINYHDPDTINVILEQSPWISLPYWLPMGLLYLSAFLSGVSAFILLALREFLQEELGVSDKDMVLHPPVEAPKLRFTVEGINDLFGYAQYDPDSPDGYKLEGPYCEWHKKRPVPLKLDNDGSVLVWGHRNRRLARDSEPCLLPSGHHPETIIRAFTNSGTAFATQRFSDTDDHYDPPANAHSPPDGAPEP